MEAAHDTSFFKVLLIVLAATAVVIPLVQRLRLPAVLGYMVVGMAVGPFGAGALVSQVPILSAIAIDDRATIEPVAELGVALLMFMIGLELSLERIWLMRRLVFGLGSAQLVLSAIVIGTIAMLLDHARPEAVVIGLALAMSSTAVVLQVLSEQKRLNTTAGRASFAVLLLQDLAVVPVLIALGALAPDNGPAERGAFLFAVAEALAGIAAIAVFGRLVLRPLFRSVARTRNEEFFVAACLLVVTGCGVIAVSSGMSMALGALIAGLLLAGTEYRRQVEVTIAPFKGLLVGIFLISIGMTLDWHALLSDFWLVLGIATALILVKAALIMVASLGFGLTWRQGLQSGLLLGPAGEFGFVVVAAAVQRQILDQATSGLVLLVAALTMATIPLMSWIGGSLAPRGRQRVIDATLLPPEPGDATPRVIIAGFGRVGRMVADMLDRHGTPYVAIDRDPDRVAYERATTPHIFYGDLTSVALLRRVNVDTALALVVTVDDPEMAATLVATARGERADLRIIARARDGRHAASLYRAGATDAVPETIEASLQLAEAVLVEVGIPMGPIIVSIHEKRAALQDEIKAAAPAASVRTLGGLRLRDTR
jgi:CPA2 family monovalent cation:H+ antiporter-2